MVWVITNRAVLATLSVLLLCKAGNAAPPDASATQNELSQIEQTLAGSKQRQQDLLSSMTTAQKEADALSAKLVASAALVENNRQLAKSADIALQKLQARMIVITSDLAQRQDALSGLLAGLQKLDQNPPPALVVEPENVLGALRGAMMFGAVVPDLRVRADGLKSTLAELHVIEADTSAQRKTAEAAVTGLETAEAEMNTLQAEKKQQALAAKADLGNEKARAEALAKQASTLRDLLAKLEKQRQDDEAQKSAEAKAAAALAQKQAEAEAKVPLLSFAASRGKLAYPVQGRLVKAFGEDTGLGTLLQGLALSSDAGVTVISPASGKVEFAGAFRSYGQLLILDAGQGYLVLLAGMQHITADIGQTIKAGEPIGTMGAGPSTLALLGPEQQSPNPVLYIEFRKDNEPIDPSPWWALDRKEALK